MKNLILILSFTISFNVFAQVNPAPPAPPAPPVEPTAPEAPISKSGDTMKVKVGDMDVLIINREKSKRNSISGDDDEEEDEDENEEMNEDDETTNKENKSPIKKKKYKAAKVELLDIDMGINVLVSNKVSNETLADDLEIKPFNSWSWTLNFLPTKIYLGSKNAMLMTSFGWRIGEYTFRNKLNFEPNKTLVYTVDSSFNKSSFDFHQLQVPLMLYFRSNKISGLGRIGIGVGGYIGALVHQEFEYKSDNRRKKVEIEEDFGFQTWRYGLSARADLGPVKIFTNYDLSPVWKDNDFTNLECGIWFDF